MSNLKNEIETLNAVLKNQPDIKELDTAIDTLSNAITKNANTVLGYDMTLIQSTKIYINRAIALAILRCYGEVDIETLTDSFDYDNPQIAYNNKNKTPIVKNTLELFDQYDIDVYNAHIVANPLQLKKFAKSCLNLKTTTVLSVDL